MMIKEKAIYFDMDGTIADLYGVSNWLECLHNESVTPYIVAKPLVNLSLLARYLNKLQQNGYSIGVISWTSMNSSEWYHERVQEAKIEWLNRHLKSVHFDEIKIVEYGVSKRVVADSPRGLLFDDNAEIREDWIGVAEGVDNIIEVLKGLL